jgi:YfiH family protein
MTLPSIPDTFRWTEESWGAALRCAPLEPLAAHLFTTRQLALSADEQWAELAAAVNVDPSNVLRLKQVHGAQVVVVRRGDPRPVRPEADALVSDDPQAALVVLAADCVPLLMADSRSGAVAAVHAGWRGTAAGVAIAALESLTREFGTRPEDVTVAIGPAIGPCCYEVGTELVDAFAAAGHARHLIDRWFLAPPPRRGDAPRTRNKLHLDVPGANRDQLILAGVAEERIFAAGVCTAMHLDVLTSYRVEKDAAVRLAGVIRARAEAL